VNPREQFLAVMRFEKDVLALKAEYGYWVTAVKRFIREGMPVVAPLPPDIPDNGTISGAVRVGGFDTAFVDVNVKAACGLEPYPAKFPMDLSPRLKPVILQQEKEYRVIKDTYGIVRQAAGKLGQFEGGN